MPKFKVHLQQYVEKTAIIEVEADDTQDAKSKALGDAHSAEWTDGDDAYDVSVYSIHDEADELVWER